ncbi:rhodanese-like domain-containing protein [Pseudoxanthomonas mexicana]|uniref:rhodanese-like domain-containing protein n=1 Tax=Pseudoxanthomonas mexicana TaxID=128785 RepID=UPI00398B6978
MIGLLKDLLGLGGERLGPRQAVQRMNAGAVLVDVREPGEYAAGHAPGSLHLPLSCIRAGGAATLDALGLDQGVEEVLLICHSGMRSRAARALLARDRRRRFVNVDGGMAAWVAAGLPLAR